MKDSAASAATARAVGEARPYAPSFIDNFMNDVKGLHLRYGLTYLLPFVLERDLFHGLA